MSRGLALAASPTFALMALGSVVQGLPPMGSGGPDMAMPSFGGGMTVMYALMALFHAPPWLHLMYRRRAARRVISASRPAAGSELDPAYRSPVQ
jgi:hypothetical protein